MERSLIIEMVEIYTVLRPFVWSDDMDIQSIEVFRNSQLKGTDQKSCSFSLTEALTKH